MIYIFIIINTDLNKYVKSIISDKYISKKIALNNELLLKNIESDIKYEPPSLIIDDIASEVKVNEPIVYIYNTHETEKYYNPFSSDYSIAPDVRLAGYILKDYLNDYNINSYIETKSITNYLKEHNLGYNGCYEASRKFILDETKNHDYKILIDIHRDSVKHKYTLYEEDNIKYARVLFVLTTKHDNYKYNEEFVNNLNDKLNSKHKGLSRGIMKRNDVIFNQDLSPRAILIELGGVDNTLDEINNTLKVISEVLNEYIIEEHLNE